MKRDTAKQDVAPWPKCPQCGAVQMISEEEAKEWVDPVTSERRKHISGWAGTCWHCGHVEKVRAA